MWWGKATKEERAGKDEYKTGLTWGCSWKGRGCRVETHVARVFQGGGQRPRHCQEMVKRH